jgi:serine/threonine protein kinase
MENSNAPDNFDPDDYVEMMQIGQGNFSELLLVEHKTTKVLYAMKIFQKMRVEQLKKQEDVLIEKHVMKKITPHNNIIKCYGSFKSEVDYILI